MTGCGASAAIRITRRLQNSRDCHISTLRRGPSATMETCETALINFPPDEHISPSNLVPGSVLHHQDHTSHNVVTIPKSVTETTVSIPPMMPDPAMEQAIDEKVKKQRPEVDVLMNGSPAEPSAAPPVPVLASMPGNPAAGPVPICPAVAGH